jgi:hypothetical protein
MHIRNWRWVLGVAALAILAGCQEVKPPSVVVPPQPWSVFVDDFLKGYFELNPTFAVIQGKHEFDGRLPDWSEAGLKRMIAWLEEKKAGALGYPDVVLDPKQRVERDHLVMQIRSDLFWRKTADYPHRNPYFYSDPLDPDVYVSREYAPLAQRLDAYLRYARAVPAALLQIKENLRGPLAKAHADIGVLTIGGLAEFYEQDVPKVFADALTPARRPEFDAANGAAIKAVRDFAAWLTERGKTATGSFALGPENFRAMLRETEGVEVPLAELEAIGRRDLDRNLRALQEACAKFAPGKSVKEAVALASAHKPEGSVVAMATRQLADLKRFVMAQGVVSVPGPEEAKVAEAPAYKRWNFAYINIPGPYERGLPSIYYVAPPDPTWPKPKQDEYVPGLGSLLFTSVHEVWPGHFLQFLHAKRATSKIGQVFVGYAFAEGWAHYTEELMWDAGLGDNTPEMHIGQLTEALLRNARFLSAIGLHTRGMTIEDSVKLFREQGHQDEGTAEQQAQRGTFDPAYLNYTMGKLMIRKLRDDWTATRGGRASWKAFHDQFLQFGGPPIPIVRKAMMGDQGSLF